MVQNGRIAADSCASSLKACDPDDFPKHSKTTLPVTLVNVKFHKEAVQQT